MNNNTSLKIPSKYDNMIYSIDKTIDGSDSFYEVWLEECCTIDGESHYASFENAKDLKSGLQNIKLIESEMEYISIFGDDLIQEYRKSYKSITGNYPKSEELKIKDIRQFTGLTQEQFASKYLIPKRSIENWESGSRTPPPYVPYLLALATGYKK